MVFGWLTNETKSFYVARPDEYSGALIYLHPDKSIPRGAKFTVRSDECALFFREGRYIGRINSGTVLLDTANIPFLGHLLVDKFTDANHFICEVFFVSLREIIFQVPYVSLGQYKDRNSANVVSIEGQLSYTVRVSDPAKLIIELGGQYANSAGVIQEVFNGRMLNQFRKAVGARSQRLPVLEVVSNTDAEAISGEIQKLGQAEFSTLGIDIGRVFDLALSLDQESLELLRSFGKQEAELALQEKGAQLATSEGFGAFNLIQGQRAALEGLGKGLGTGNAPMIMTGMGLGANLTNPPGRPAQRSATPARPAAALAGAAGYILVTEHGETGPYTARQVALMAISKGLGLDKMLIRGVEDPAEMVIPAEHEPQIAAEYRRRMPAETSATQPASGKAPGTQAFDLAMAAAIQDGVLTRAEIDMLQHMAVALGLDADTAAARARIDAIATSKNIRIEE